MIAHAFLSVTALSIFRERLRILLTPRYFVLDRPGGFGRGGRRAFIEPIAAAEIGTSWTAAVEAVRKSLPRAGRHGTRIDVVFSSVWARCELIAVGNAILSDEETALLVRTQFARQYPETTEGGWPLRHAMQNGNLLAAGMQPGLLGALREAAVAAGMRLARAEPLFAWTFDRYQQDLTRLDGWMLLDEPGMLTAACIEQGQLVSLCAQRCEAQPEEMAARLLERQNALLRRPAYNVCAFALGERTLRLPSPWRTVLQRNIFENLDVVPPSSMAAGAASSSQ